jgi:hypothetical protein
MATSAQRDRLASALAQLSGDEINAAIAALGDGEHLTNLAQVLNVKKPALRAHPDPASLLRARVRSGGPARATMAALEIAGLCADACIDDLGDRADDPSHDDMVEVLPPLVEEFAAKIVTLMLAAYVAMDAPCAAVFDELLDTDERFVIGPPAPDAAPAPTHDPMPNAPPDDPEIEAKRARRRDADAKKKDAARKLRENREAAAAALRAARKKRAT